MSSPQKLLPYSYVTAGISDAAIGIAVASQLPGRALGGPADALRHLVVSAELTSVFGDATAVGLLDAHEAQDFNPNRADTAQDAYVNSIGIAIGNFVAQQGGTFADVVDLSVQALSGSLSGYSWRDFGPGGALTMNEQGFYVPPLDGVTLTLGQSEERPMSNIRSLSAAIFVLGLLVFSGASQAISGAYTIDETKFQASTKDFPACMLNTPSSFSQRVINFPGQEIA